MFKDFIKEAANYIQYINGIEIVRIGRHNKILKGNIDKKNSKVYFLVRLEISMKDENCQYNVCRILPNEIIYDGDKFARVDPDDFVVKDDLLQLTESDKKALNIAVDRWLKGRREEMKNGRLNSIWP